MQKKEIYIVPPEQMTELLASWTGRGSLYVPDPQGRLVSYRDNIQIGWKAVPVWGGIKEFLFPPRIDAVSEAEPPAAENIVVGIRNCDLRAMEHILDRVFTGNVPDMTYVGMRERLTIVSVDCVSPADTCFCPAVGGVPFCETGFDLNITPVTGGFLVETGSKKGDDLLTVMDLARAGEGDLKKREMERSGAVRKAGQTLPENYIDGNFRDKIENILDDEFWAETARTCMECGGCNFVCPTCTCFMLNDESDKKSFSKIRLWDSCQFSGYKQYPDKISRLDERWKRLRYRYRCKFGLMLEEFNLPGCTGCGRCILVCPAKIDIREVLSC